MSTQNINIYSRSIWLWDTCVNFNKIWQHRLATRVQAAWVHIVVVCKCHYFSLHLLTSLMLVWMCLPIPKLFFLKSSIAHRSTHEENVQVQGLQLSVSWSQWKTVISEWSPNKEREWLLARGKHSQYTIILTICPREALVYYPKFDGKYTLFEVFYSCKR